VKAWCRSSSTTAASVLAELTSSTNLGRLTTLPPVNGAHQRGQLKRGAPAASDGVNRGETVVSSPTHPGRQRISPAPELAAAPLAGSTAPARLLAGNGARRGARPLVASLASCLWRRTGVVQLTEEGAVRLITEGGRGGLTPPPAATFNAAVRCKGAWLSRFELYAYVLLCVCELYLFGCRQFPELLRPELLFLYLKKLGRVA
jgi:hypothetical protein